MTLIFMKGLHCKTAVSPHGLESEKKVSPCWWLCEQSRAVNCVILRHVRTFLIQTHYSVYSLQPQSVIFNCISLLIAKPLHAVDKEYPPGVCTVMQRINMEEASNFSSSIPRFWEPLLFLCQATHRCFDSLGLWLVCWLPHNYVHSCLSFSLFALKVSRMQLSVRPTQKNRHGKHWICLTKTWFSCYQ